MADDELDPDLFEEDFEDGFEDFDFDEDDLNDSRCSSEQRMTKTSRKSRPTRTLPRPKRPGALSCLELIG
jgi:hypothetical protein